MYPMNCGGMIRAVCADMSFGIAARFAAVDVSRGLLHVGRREIAPRRHHLGQRRGPARHHHRAGRGRRQHQSPAALRILARELLRQCAAPGNADDVHLLVAEPVQQFVREPREPGKPPRPPAHLRAADARHVENDDFSFGHRFHERKAQLEIRADAVEQQQRQADLAVLGRDAQVDAIDLDEFDLGFAHLWWT